jgi:methyl-accepting chemotaxis protein
MAGNLTAQVRGIAKVVTAVANGDLKRKLTVEAKGEIAALADTINDMIDTLATFADQVTTWPARSASRASSAARRTCPARPAPGAT